MKAYLVAYEIRNKVNGHTSTHNAIVVDKHPVVWLAQVPQLFSKYYTSRLLFYAEIPIELLDNPSVRQTYAIEDQP